MGSALAPLVESGEEVERWEDGVEWCEGVEWLGAPFIGGEGNGRGSRRWHCPMGGQGWRQG
jgi:hypothetical protein